MWGRVTLAATARHQIRGWEDTTPIHAAPFNRKGYKNLSKSRDRGITDNSRWHRSLRDFRRGKECRP